MSEIDRSHDEIRELLAQVALGSATEAEGARVREHVLTCEDCRRELASLEAAAALVGLAAPASGRGHLGAVRSRLLERIAAERTTVAAGAAGTIVPGRARPRPGGWAGWATAAVAILALGTLVFAANRARTAAQAELVASRGAAEAEIARLRDSLAAQESVLTALIGPQVKVVDLASTGSREPRGRMFWDQLAGRWTFIAHDLPALGPGRTYQLWVITTGGARVSAGTFEPEGGSALVQATYPLPPDQLGAVAVTEEPAGGVPQPTGSIVIAGTPG